jgi:ribosomal protein S18 acetylase RimI-like enzyme
MSNLRYRQAEPSDIPGMARLRALKRGTKEYWTDRISQYFEGEHNPQLALPTRVAFVAIEDETVVGFIAGHLSRRYSCDGELQWIFVDPDHRAGGIASELVRLLAKWFVEQNAFKICVDVDPSNTTAHRFYKRLGAVELNPHWLVWSDIRTVAEQPGAMDAKS